MKATEAKLLTFLKKSPQFVIPIYQRTYSWTIAECRQLWDDILRAGSRDDVSVHFIGSIVYVEDGLSQVTSHAPLLVIDGQQRLTTLTLLLANLATAIGETEPVDGFTKRKINNYYLLNPEESGDRRYKLLLTQTDRASLLALVEGTSPPTDASLRIAENSDFFRRMIEEASGDLARVCTGLAKLVVVDIALNREHDNPQLIFESMNSTGKALSQADLIRNFVLMGLEPGFQTRLYERYWRPMEAVFGQRAYSSMFDGFMRHYLTVKTGEIPNLGDVYAAFKAYAMSSRVAHEDVEVLVQDLHHWAQRFCRMALGQEPDRDLRDAFHNLRELKVDVAYPFLHYCPAREQVWLYKWLNRNELHAIRAAHDLNRVAARIHPVPNPGTGAGDERRPVDLLTADGARTPSPLSPLRRAVPWESRGEELPLLGPVPLYGLRPAHLS